VSVFRTVAVGEGVRFHHLPEERFKTLTFQAIFHLPLGPDVAEAALLPSLLRRGTVRHPDLASIGRRLENLYGAALEGDVSRMGERHLLHVAVDLVAPRHLPESASVLQEGLAFLREVVFEPRLEGGLFPRQVFDQERENLARFVAGLLDDRAAFAVERCIQTMCEGEPYGNYPYGRPEDLRALDGKRVVDRYGRIHATAPLDLFAVGPADPELLEDEARAFARALGRRRSVLDPPDPAPHPRRPVRRAEERLDVDQAKVVLGFRVDVRRGPEEDPGAALFAAVLGGGPASKLFRKVREERSLAYYASASFERTKGLLLVQAGVNPESVEAAIDLCLEQVEALRRGEVDEAEFEPARRALRLRLRSLGDSPSGQIGYEVERRLLAREGGPERELASLERASRDAIVEAATRVRLDTIFVLRPQREHR
jgi:predicted Zn-dependent peptidase